MNIRLVSAISLVCALIAAIFGQFSVRAQPATVPTYTVALPLIAFRGTPGAPAPARPEPNPIAITVTPDSGRAFSAAIGAEGGSLTATGADGATYQLTIPPAALPYSATITLIPARTAGLPFAAGDLASVLIEPTGLTLLLPATLAITPANGGTALTAHSFEADGTEMHLFPVSGAQPQGIAVANAATMHPQVLRGYGVTNVTSAERETQAQRAPTRFVDWLEQEIARAGGAEISVPTDFINQYLQTELTPSTDMTRMERTLAEYVRIDQLMQVHGDIFEAGYLAQIGDRQFQNLLQNTAASAHQICVAQLRPSEGARIVRLIGYARKVRPDDSVAALQARVNKCLRFELRFESTLTEQSAKMTRSVTAEASIPLMADDTLRMTGYGISNITRTSWEGERPCASATIEPANSTFWATGGSLGLRLVPGRNNTGMAELIYSPGVNLQAIYTFHCPAPNGGIVDVPMVIPWAAYYDLMHLWDRVTIDQLNYRMLAQGVDIDRFTGWVYHDSKAMGDVTITENSQFELTHKPQL